MAESNKAVKESQPYLKRARVRDHSPLRDAKADFKQGINIIIGKNGAGKTRFMNLVSKLLDIDQESTIGSGCELTIIDAYEIVAKFGETIKRISDADTVLEESRELIVKVTYNKVSITGESIFDALTKLKIDLSLLPVFLPCFNTAWNSFVWSAYSG